jgi:thioesterase domain-containing protein
MSAELLGGGRDTVVVFNPAGAGCAFFFAADMSGSVTTYRHVAAKLDSRHPAYGLCVPQWAKKDATITVQSIAANYVTEIERRVVPGGKAIVAGYSFGGMVAFEIASQLRNRGLVEPLPVIVDMEVLHAPGVRERTVGQKAFDAMRNLPAWMVHEAAHFHARAFALRCYGNGGKLMRVMTGRPAEEKLDPRVYFGMANLPDGLGSVVNAMYSAMHAYVPTRYGGRVILLRAKVPNLFRSRDAMMGWQSVSSGGLDVRTIPGRHDDCMSEEHGVELAAVLESCAATLESGSTAEIV